MARVEIPLVILDHESGLVTEGASVTIKSRVTNGVVPVYAGETELNEITQPLVSDESGRVQGWLPRGAYVAEITPPGKTMYPEPMDLVPAADGSFDPAWVPDEGIPASKISGLNFFAPRLTDSFSTASSIPAGTEETGVVELAPGVKIVRVETSHPARVRLYSTAAKRDADAERELGTDPTGDHGMLLEIATGPTLLAFDLSPQAFGSNQDLPKSSNFYYAIENRDVAGRTITVTLDWQQTEE
jgi:hypothetical protein